MKTITELQVKRVASDLNEIVSENCHGSALRGLTVVAGAFAALLDTYAMPNAENPQGMCDSPKAFRKYFAEMITSLPPIKRTRQRKAL